MDSRTACHAERHTEADQPQSLAKRESQHILAACAQRHSEGLATNLQSY
jgi:hypothetical protein